MTTLLVDDLIEQHPDDAMVVLLIRVKLATPRVFLHRVAEHADVIVRRCSWCTDVIGFKDSEGAPGITDGICPKCAAAYLRSSRN